MLVNMERLRLYVISLIFVQLLCIPTMHAQAIAYSKILFDKLMNTGQYYSVIRPVNDVSDQVKVNLSVCLRSIIEFDSQKESLLTSAYLVVNWYDTYFQWNTSDYDGTYYLYMRPDTVWKPDLSLRNDISEVKGIGSNELLLSVYNDGMIAWWPYSVFQSTCKVDITYFPFDTQTCSLIFTVWSYDKSEVDLYKVSDEVCLSDYEENSVWSVESTYVHKLNHPLEATIFFDLKLKRKPLFFLLNVIIPVIMLSILNSFVFLLPARSSEKASFVVTVFLSLAVFLTIVTGTLPPNSDNVSYLGLYLIIMIGLSTSAVIMTVLQLRLHCRDETADPVPSWLIKLHKCVDRVRCRRCNKVRPAPQAQNLQRISVSEFTSTTDEKTAEVKVIPPSERDTTLEVTWNNVSNSLDFVLFWLFLTAVISTTAAFLLIMATGGQ